MGGSTSFPKEKYARDHIVIVTGGNTGIGYEIAKQIAMMGAHVIIACRSEERATSAIQKMQSDFQEELSKSDKSKIPEIDEISVEFMKLDLASFKSVLVFVDKFRSSGSKLHTLVCNAGVVMHRQAYTEDDNEMHFQVNYLSHFLLTVKLLPIMKESGDDCRVVSTSSFVHYSANWKFDEIQGRKYTPDKFPRRDYYNFSKAYQIMQMYVMGPKLAKSNVTITCIDPGYVLTESPRNFNDMKCIMCLLICARPCAKQPIQGADCAIDAAVNPKYKGVRDVYYSGCKEKQTSAMVRNKDYQKQLWDYSLERLKDHLSDSDMQVKHPVYRRLDHGGFTVCDAVKLYLGKTYELEVNSAS